MRKLLAYLLLMLASSILAACKMSEPVAEYQYTGFAVIGTATPSPTITVTLTNVPIQTAGSTAEPVWVCVDTGIPEGHVNLRECASIGCRVIHVLADGQQVRLLAEGDWVLVDVNGMIGYVYAKYIGRCQ